MPGKDTVLKPIHTKNNIYNDNYTEMCFSTFPYFPTLEKKGLGWGRGYCVMTEIAKWPKTD